MSDSSGNRPYGSDGADSGSSQQPPAYPPPQQNPFGQPPPPPSQQPHPASDQPQSTPPPQPFGQPQYGQHGQPAYAQPSYGQPAVDPDKRPTTVTAAAIITIALSGIVFVLLALGLVALGVARDDVVEQMSGEPALGDIDPNDLVTVLFVVFAAFLVWCLLAIVLAVFALRRSPGARIGLVVSSALAATLSLLGISSGTSLVTLVGAIAVIVLLFTGGAGAWYSRGRGGQGRGGLAPPVA